MFSVCPHLGGGSGQSPAGGEVSPARGGGGQVSPAGGGVRSVQLGGSGQSPARGGVSGQSSRGEGGQHLAPSCGRYASCVHAGGLSCVIYKFSICYLSIEVFFKKTVFIPLESESDFVCKSYFPTEFTFAWSGG